MTIKSILILTLLGITLVASKLTTINKVSSQYVPISNRYPGINLPGSDPLVQIELVYDVTCPDSVNFDVKWRQVVQKLGQNHPGKFSYRYAMHVLPFRIFSFKLTQAIRYVNDNKGAEQALRVLHHYFDTYKNWIEEEINNTPLSKLMDELAKDLSTFTGLDEAEIRKQVAHYSKTDGKTRSWVKYAMGTLHAGTAPTFFVNGARLDGFASKSVDELVDYLSALI